MCFYERDTPVRSRPGDHRVLGLRAHHTRVKHCLLENKVYHIVGAYSRLMPVGLEPPYQQFGTLYPGTEVTREQGHAIYEYTADSEVWTLLMKIRTAEREDCCGPPRRASGSRRPYVFKST